MNLSKYIAAVAVVAGMTSCVGDLDLKPNDPNYGSSSDFQAVLAKCYSGMAVSGQTGPGSSDISGLDNGTGQYTRALFMMQEFPTDEAIWIWEDAGVIDLVTDTWDASNGNIYGTYARLYSHIAVCNDFLTLTASAEGENIAYMRLQARTLRAFSYFQALDIFGNPTFVTEDQTEPEQIMRADLYKWLAAELEDIVAGFKAEKRTTFYGEVGLDGAQALLARLYLNASVYTDGTPAYDLCQQHCSEIIARHQGGGYKGSGLATNYLDLFCRNNDQYMPGGSKSAENEILWGIPYDQTNTQTYGGTQFLVAACIANGNMTDDGFDCSSANYGTTEGWKCIHAVEQFSDKFEAGDKRQDLWLKEANGFKKENTKLSDFSNGYACIKFTNLVANGDGTFSRPDTPNWISTDLPLIRLADVYLMYAEGFVLGGKGDATTALQYVNYLRTRAGLAEWTGSDLTPDNLIDERGRELYFELTRRSDLIRYGKFTGGSYIWAWKGYIAEGNSISNHYRLMPIPDQILAAQPSFKQNPGY